MTEILQTLLNMGSICIRNFMNLNMVSLIYISDIFTLSIGLSQLSNKGYKLKIYLITDSSFIIFCWTFNIN